MKTFFLLTVVFLISALCLKPMVFAADVVDAGNKICPLSGDEIKGKDFVEYKGKRYGICCAMCKKEFLKNPEKYIATLENAGAASAHAH